MEAGSSMRDRKQYCYLGNEAGREEPRVDRGLATGGCWLGGEGAGGGRGGGGLQPRGVSRERGRGGFLGHCNTDDNEIMMMTMIMMMMRGTQMILRRGTLILSS